MGRSGRGSVYHPSKKDEQHQDAKDHGNSRAQAHLRMLQCWGDWLDHISLQCAVHQIQATFDALLGEEHDEDVSAKIASWYEAFERSRPELQEPSSVGMERDREVANKLRQSIADEGYVLFPLAERVVVDGFGGAFEHFNGVYQAVTGGSGASVQLFAHIGDMDRGFEERRHGVVELGSPYLQLVGGRWSVCEEFGVRKSQTRAEITSDAFSPEHIASESAWSCFRRGSRDLESHTVTVRLAADIDLTPQKRWHRATPNLPSWTISNMPPADIDNKRQVQSLLSKLGGRRAGNIQRGEMPNKRDLIRTKQKNQLGLRTTRESRLNEGSAVPMIAASTTADDSHPTDAAPNGMDVVAAPQSAALVNPEADTGTITSDIPDVPHAVSLASDDRDAHVSDAGVEETDILPHVSEKLPEAFKGRTLDLYQCPDTGRRWFWHAETEAIYFEDDLRDDGWNKFFDFDDTGQRYWWWWHETTKGWFFEGCSTGM